MHSIGHHCPWALSQSQQNEHVYGVEVQSPASDSTMQSMNPCCCVTTKKPNVAPSIMPRLVTCSIGSIVTVIAMTPPEVVQVCQQASTLPSELSAFVRHAAEKSDRGVIHLQGNHTAQFMRELSQQEFALLKVANESFASH
jgi:hypothetical protein